MTMMVRNKTEAQRQTDRNRRQELLDKNVVHPEAQWVKVHVNAESVMPNGATHHIGRRTIKLTKDQWDDWKEGL